MAEKKTNEAFDVFNEFFKNIRELGHMLSREDLAIAMESLREAQREVEWKRQEQIEKEREAKRLEKERIMVDTSGSMSDEMITAAYSEVNGAIDQFNGKLEGFLGFFDAAVIPPIPFSDEDEFMVIKPKGGGGTDFNVIFKYVNDHMSDEPPESIIIFTDGYAPFPDEEKTNGIPVLWLLNNKDVEPPWGKIARIEV